MMRQATITSRAMDAALDLYDRSVDHHACGLFSLPRNSLSVVQERHSAQDQLEVFGRQFADQAVVGRDDRVGQVPFAVL